VSYVAYAPRYRRRQTPTTVRLLVCRHYTLVLLIPSLTLTEKLASLSRCMPVQFWTIGLIKFEHLKF